MPDARIKDARANALHQVTHRLVTTHGFLVLEDLAVKAMARGVGRRAGARSFRRSVSDASLGELRRQIKYKAQWQARTVVTVDRFYASIQRCSGCEHQHKELTLSDRSWTCPACGAEHDRDHNAAKNILSEGLRLHSDYTRGAADEPSVATPRIGERKARGADKGSGVERSPSREPAASSCRSRRLERRRAGT